MTLLCGRCLQRGFMQRPYYGRFLHLASAPDTFWNEFRIDLNKSTFLERLANNTKPTWSDLRIPKKLRNFPAAEDSKRQRPSGGQFGVLVPLCVVEGTPSVLFTLRSYALYKHRGEISFPGGRVDPNDESVIHAALRETEEEIGLNRSKVEVWGQLPELPARFGGTLTAVVGNIGELSLEDLNPNTYEVEEIFTVSLQKLCSANLRAKTTFRRGSENVYTMPVFFPEGHLQGHRIWGMTALLLNHVLRLLVPEHYKIPKA